MIYWKKFEKINDFGQNVIKLEMKNLLLGELNIGKKEVVYQ